MPAITLILLVTIVSPAFSYKFPLHAQCKLKWTWDKTNCSTVHELLVAQAAKWQGPEGCDSGGEKCLYEVTADSGNELNMTHTTPVKKYVDDITFKFCNSRCGKLKHDHERPKRSVKAMVKQFIAPGAGCQIAGLSRSRIWYAVLDYGTNYCNMRNLVDGSGLSSLPDFSEETSDGICTMFSSADCSKY